MDVDAATVNSSSSRILDYASESDSDVEAAMLDVTWKGGDADADSSDAESVDSQQEDLLKYANLSPFHHLYTVFLTFLKCSFFSAFY